MPQTPIVLGIILRIEMRGWHGPPPRLALDPIRIEDGERGLDQIFFYDLSPKEEALTVEAACARVGSRLERLLLSAEALGGGMVFAARLRLEVGLWVGGGQASFSYSWPVEFLQILAAADVELGVSHYVADAGASGEDDETDDSWG
jgi:hypothetical protein